MRKIITSALLATIFLGVIGCLPRNSSSNIGENIIQEKLISENTIEEKLISEKIVSENIILENTIQENLVSEYLIEEMLLVEKSIPSNIKLLELSASVIDSETYKSIAQNYDVNWKSVIEKVAVGSSVIMFTGVAAGISSAVGSPVSFVFISSFTGAVKDAVLGAVIGGAIGAVVGAVQSGGDVRAIRKYAIEGAADGYMWGAITGGFSGYRAMVANARYVEAFAKYGDDVTQLVKVHGDDVISILNKFDLLKSGGKISKGRFISVMENSSEKVQKELLSVLKNLENPKDVNRAVMYMEAWGDDGIKNLKKWKGIIPEKINYKQLQRMKQINYSGTRKIANAVKNLKGLTLSEEEISKCLIDKKYFADLVKQKTGKAFCSASDEIKGYQEFFIRLKNAGNESQIKKLWANQAVKDYIKNTGIRAGGVHEWLMAKNFESFLVDPKWGNDGNYLILALDKLVQKTGNVTFKNGGSHGNLWSNSFHQRLGDIIDTCDNAAEVYEKIQAYAKEVLTMDSYTEFSQILYSVF